MATEQRIREPFRRGPMAPSFGSVVLAEESNQDPSSLDTHAPALRHLVTESGALLLRGFRFDLDSLEAFSFHFGRRFLVHPGTVRGGRVKLTDTTATVDAGVLPFPWHRELGYAPGAPDIVLFCCRQPAQDGGETMLTDGCAILDGLPPSTRRFVTNRRVRYTYDRPREAWPSALGGAATQPQADRALCEMASLLPPGDELAWDFDDEGVTIRFTTSMLTATRWGRRPAFCNQVIFQVKRGGRIALDDGSKIPRKVVARAERRARDASYAIGWQRGDLAILDNSRIMHARAAITDPARSVWARVCYCDF
jgi:alpha-ketoglutarate-dependent taurine dioxygenase